MFTTDNRIQIAKEHRLKKRLSQHFLIDEAILQAITNASFNHDSNTPLIEIGPGAGFLTDFLLHSSHPITVIEVDDDWVKHLNKSFGEHERFELLHKSILKVNLLDIVKEKCIIIGNLPYHLTGPILFHTLGELSDTQHFSRQHLEKAIFMVQKEVGDRLTAKPGSKAYGQLSIQMQFWYDVTTVIDVPPKAFIPPPKVNSTVVQFTPRTQPFMPIDNLNHMEHLIKSAFKHRRKTLFNNLKMAQLGSEEDLKAHLSDLTIAHQARPETISIETYGRLSNALNR